jgi:ubiquinone/menaquinone biosynthesis C-methylase UbiE
VDQAEFRDARLVSLYDAEYGWSHDDDFFLGLVNETQAAQVLDLGCGTGRLALALAREGHTVTGVDPATASLEAARAKPGGENVTWIEGTSAVLGDGSFEVAIMTSHVAQVFVTEEEWAGALADLRRALVPGGRLAFDARDPRARAWERWNPVDSRRQVVSPEGEAVTVWSEVTAVADAVVTFTNHYVVSDGEELLSTASLRFRTEEELRGSVRAAGYQVEQIYGGWDRQPAGAGDGELIVVARARRPASRAHLPISARFCANMHVSA